MFEIKILGVDEAVRSVLALPGKIDTEGLLERVAGDFAGRLRAATPIGYSGQLPRSVVVSVGEKSASVGYEEAVETAGKPEIDKRRKQHSVLFRPPAKKRRWVTIGELDDIADEVTNAYSHEAAEVLEQGLAEEIDRVVS